MKTFACIAGKGGKRGQFGPGGLSGIRIHGLDDGMQFSQVSCVLLVKALTTLGGLHD